MAASIEKWVKAHPVAALFILAFAITWLGWVPQALHSHGLFPFDSPIFYVLGGTGPLLAVFVVLRIVRGRWEFGEPFTAYLRWREGGVWYAVALLLFPALWIISLLAMGNLKTEVEKLAGPLAVLSTFAVSFVAAIPEEVAWRWFALPRLQQRYNALVASVIVWFFASIWHLPLLMTKGSVMAAYPKLPFFLEVLALTILYTWVFNSTHGSLLFVTLFHAASNSVGPFLGLPQAVVMWLAAAAVIIVAGHKRLSRQDEQRIQQDLPAPAIRH